MLLRSSFYAQKCALTAKKCSTMLSLDFSMLIILAIPKARFVLHAQEIVMTEQLICYLQCCSSCGAVFG